MAYRVMQKFWLDISKRDERELAQQLAVLKSGRAYTSTIRNALRLFLDLKQGNVQVLFELFPWIKEALPTSAGPADPRLQEQIARLEALLVAQGNVPVQRAEPAQPRVEIASEKSNTKTVAQNFMESMKGFASGFFD